MEKRKKRVPTKILLEKIWGKEPVEYNPLFTAISGNPYAGIFMSKVVQVAHQDKLLCFTTDKHELNPETGLTYAQEQKAIKIWKRMGVFAIEKAGNPPEDHFDFNSAKLLRVVAKHLDKKGAEALERAAQYTEDARKGEKNGKR